MQRGIETRGTEICGMREQGGLFQKTSSAGARQGTGKEAGVHRGKRREGMQPGNKRGATPKVALKQNGRCMACIPFSRPYQCL